MRHIPEAHSLARHANITSEFIRWLRVEGHSLVAAARLLGGSAWAKRAEDVVKTARAGHDVAARRADLLALRKLLHLEFTSQLESGEALRFALPDPDDPRAEEAQLCAEALDRGVRALEALRLVGVVNLRETA
ncbi:MAG: hypothetical protein R3D80_05570 [Paracoccaceae bacterium]